MSDARYVAGINAVREALQSSHPPEKVFLRRQPSARHRALADLARRRGVPCVTSGDRELERMAGGRHQGVVALVAGGLQRIELDDLTAGKEDLVVALDGITDPMNLGAVLRTAEAAGARAALLPRRRSASVGSVAMTASAGALNHLPLVSVSSLADALLRLKELGYAVVGLDVEGEPLYGVSSHLTGPLVVVLGAEGAGMHRLVKSRCDRLVRIPLFGRVQSLNVSVACGVALFELVRIRREAK